MSEVSDQAKSVRATWLWVWSVLGTLTAAATCISLVKHGFDIRLYGLPAEILQRYVVLRDALFWPLVEALRYCGLTMPWWLKDLIVAYCVAAGAVGRGTRSMRLAEVPRHKVKFRAWYAADPLDDLVDDNWVMDALLWPLTVAKWVRVKGAVIPKLGRRAKPTSAAAFNRTRRIAIRNLYIIRLRWFFFYLAIIPPLVIAYFLWSYLQNVFGPGG